MLMLRRAHRLAAALMICLGIVVGCSMTTSQERAANTEQAGYARQERIEKKRVVLIDKYQRCIDKAGFSERNAAACEKYLHEAADLR